MNNEKEIPFRAFDSELMHQEISIPEGFKATIEGNKIILTRIENEDERVRKALITYFQRFPYGGIGNAGTNPKEAIAWLEKLGQKPRKVSIWKHWKDGICGNGEGKLIYLIKNGDAYSLSSSLGYECDYIELSELDNLMLEKQGNQKLPIEKLPEEMKTIEESLGFTTQKECDEYNKMVSELIMSAGNKIKPKFEVGDTIRLKNSTAEYTIESISDGCYHGKGWSLNIIDADKSGDYVLVEHKTAWSKEDEGVLLESISVLQNSCHWVLADKLKSLKQRYTWKPSKEQIVALRWILNNIPYNKYKEEISGLLDQIK